MQGLINLLRGHVRLQVEGAFPERFLNICAANSLAFWGLVYESETCLVVTMSRKSFHKLRPYADRAMCTVTELSRTGLPFFLGRFRKRYTFLVGLALCTIAVLFLSQFLMDVKVTGNQLVPTNRILSELKDLGVHVGAYGPSLDEGLIEQELLLRIPELSFFALNITGSRANVIVRERVPKPQLIDSKTPSNVVATKAGVITKIEALQGVAIVKKGSTVLPGELLISGVADIESPAQDGSSVGTRFLHAKGNVYARTWYTLEAQTPLVTSAKTYTGRQKQHISLLVGEKRINFYFNGRISFDSYDKIEQTHQITLPGDFIFPIKLHTEQYVEYTVRDAAVDRASAEEFLKADLMEELEANIGTGEILNMEYKVVEQNNMLVVTLSAECEEQIGQVVALPTENGESADPAVSEDGAGT